MRKPKRFALLLLLLIGVVSVALEGYAVFAKSKDDIVYPVKVLENCKDETECRAYCGNPDHMGVCVTFAEQHNLMSKEEVAQARKFAKVGKGPGGCRNFDQCETYCHDVAHIEECLAFAEQQGFMSSEELQEAKKVAKALREGAQLPGGCKNKEECEVYCKDPSRMGECIEFAEKAGFLSSEELEEARKVVKALQSGATLPGNCRGKEECETYCQDPSHMEECIVFAEAAGFIPPEEAAMARKMMPLMMRGEMPGGCKSKEECESYCVDESHLEECVEFAQKAGLMDEEELEMFRKTGGKGPGSCKGREECDAFCNNPANQEVCFQFAKEHGLIGQEEIAHMQEGMQRFREGIKATPPEVAECLKSKIGEEVLEKIEAGAFMPNPQLGEYMRSCFEQFMPKQFLIEGAHPEGIGPEERIEFRGPGGCTSEEECKTYCSDPAHQEECAPFREIEQRVPSRVHPREEERRVNVEREIHQRAPESSTPEQFACIERVVGGFQNLQGPPTAEQEQRIRDECFPHTPQQIQPPPEQFIPSHEEQATPQMLPAPIPPEFEPQGSLLYMLELFINLLFR